MSMHQNQSELASLPATEATRQSDRAWLASSLARYVVHHRRELDLTVAQAATLSGMELSEWLALEAGWVPGDRKVHHAIAGALQVDISNIGILADIATNHQHRC